jgi:hypothetical protein
MADNNINELIYDINFQVLSFVCETAKRDSTQAQLLFGLPDELVESLKDLSPKQIELISKTQMCLLTLKNCADQNYWNKLIKGSLLDTDIHKLNLVSIGLMHFNNNKLPFEEQTTKDKE